MTEEFKSRVKSLVSNKKTGDVTGLRLDGVKAFLDFSQYRELPWDKPEVGAIVKIRVDPREPSKEGYARYWVKAIERQDEPDWEPEPEHGFVPYDDGLPESERKAQAVREVLDAEQDRERRLDRRKALECAADVVVALVKDSPDTYTPETLSKLIDLCIERFKLGIDE